MTASMRTSATLALAALAGGCASLGARGYHGPVSDHFDGTHFHNLARFSDALIGDAVRRAVSILAGSNTGGTKWVIAPTDTPPARVGGGRLRVTFVNHATLLVQTDSLNILTDPIWSERASPVHWAGLRRGRAVLRREVRRASRRRRHVRRHHDVLSSVAPLSERSMRSAARRSRMRS